MPVAEALARVHEHMTAEPGAMPPDASDWVLVAAAFAGFVAAWCVKANREKGGGGQTRDDSRLLAQPTCALRKQVDVRARLDRGVQPATER